MDYIPTLILIGSLIATYKACCKIHSKTDKAYHTQCIVDSYSEEELNIMLQHISGTERCYTAEMAASILFEILVKL